MSGYGLVYKDKLKLLSPSTLSGVTYGPGLGQVLLCYGQQNHQW